jgi:hypothetical protein
VIEKTRAHAMIVDGLARLVHRRQPPVTPHGVLEFGCCSVNPELALLRSGFYSAVPPALRG